jgi:hypothetical protein
VDPRRGLGAAYAFVEEGLVIQSFFNPTLFRAGEIGGRALGVNFVWCEWAVGYHILWSLLIPIALTEVWDAHAGSDTRRSRSSDRRRLDREEVVRTPQLDRSASARDGAGRAPCHNVFGFFVVTAGNRMDQTGQAVGGLITLVFLALLARRLQRGVGRSSHSHLPLENLTKEMEFAHLEIAVNRSRILETFRRCFCNTSQISATHRRRLKCGCGCGTLFELPERN